MSSEYDEGSGSVDAAVGPPRYLSADCGRNCCELSPLPNAYLSANCGRNCCIKGAAVAARAADWSELSPPPRYLSLAACGLNWKLSAAPVYLSLDGGRNCVNGGESGKAAGAVVAPPAPAKARLLLLADGTAMDDPWRYSGGVSGYGSADEVAGGNGTGGGGRGTEECFLFVPTTRPLPLYRWSSAPAPAPAPAPVPALPTAPLPPR